MGARSIGPARSDRRERVTAAQGGAPALIANTIRPVRKGTPAALPRDRGREYLAIALASATVMLYEIAITRILSVVLWYHFAFLAVSLAMLGLGVPGVWFALRGAGPRSLERALIASAIAVPLSLMVLLQYGGPLPWRTALATVCILAPMLALGSAVCILLLRARGREIGRIYGADLMGATAGALVVVPLMHVLPTPVILVGSALLPALALLALGRTATGIVLLALVAGPLVWHEPLRVRHGKVYSENTENLLYEKWTPTARLTVISTAFHKRAFGWGMGANYVPRRVEQLWLEQDGSAGTPITRLNVPPAALEHLFYDVTNLAHQLQTPASVCVIGAGGGRDVLAALAAGAREVDAVELNPGIVNLVSRDFGSYSGDVYHLPGVRAVVDEGRSFLTRTPRQYDLVQISLIDSWAATAAGAYALSENYLYTVEAYRQYWRRLKPGGMLSTSRWLTDLEAVRLANLVREALRLEGVDDPRAHLAIALGDKVATVIASRAPFASGLRDTLEAACDRRGFVLQWPVRAASAASSDIDLVLREGVAAFRDRGVDVSAPVDERPFFFHNIAIFGGARRSDATSILNNARAVLLLRSLMIVVSVLAVLLFFLPFALGGALSRGPEFWRGSTFFALIGLGFLLVEIPMIQRMILYLGHPSHAITVVLASMLLGAGLGATVSGRLPNRALPGWGIALVALIALANLGFSPLFAATIGWPWALRTIAAFMISGLTGFLMGFALPLGMFRFGDRSKAWFWAVNGACGVVASVCSLGLAMTFGFQGVTWLGVAAYALAALLLLGQPVEGAPATDPPRSARKRNLAQSVG